MIAPYIAWYMSERIPDIHAFAINVPSSFDLIRRAGTTPYEIFWKHASMQLRVTCTQIAKTQG
jgi:hypothetical protein